MKMDTSLHQRLEQQRVGEQGQEAADVAGGVEAGDLRFGRHGGRLGRAVLGGIEQDGVFTHQQSGIPAQLHQHVEERLVHRLARCHAQHRSSAFTALDGEQQTGEGGIELDAGLGERVAGGEARIQRRLFTGLQGYDLDFGAQRLSEIGLHAQLAEACRQRKQRQRQHRCRGES